MIDPLMCLKTNKKEGMMIWILFQEPRFLFWEFLVLDTKSWYKQKSLLHEKKSFSCGKQPYILINDLKFVKYSRKNK